MKPPRLKCKLARFKFRKIQNIVNDFIHVHTAAFYHPQRFFLLRIRLLTQQLPDIAKHAIDRGSQFMRHICNKLRLYLERLLRFLLHLSDFPAQMLFFQCVICHAYVHLRLSAAVYNPHFYREAGTVLTVRHKILKFMT